ncbi:hypothetical protein [Acidilobus sp.]|uniref:hypothetical protein n=1 Tax=Acidilobus sp. TaxID=1872109 RepID=UPI003D02BADB
MTVRGISDEVAELMLILVVLAVGGAFLSYYYVTLTQYEGSVGNGYEYLQYLVPMSAWSAGDQVYATFSTGPYGVRLLNVLVNSSPASCNVTVGGVAYKLPADLPAASMGYVSCRWSGPGLVTLVTGSGEVSVYAGP